VNSKKITKPIEILLLTFATVLIALGVYFFKFPNHFSFGGVTGMAVIASKFLPITASDFTFAANMVLLVVGFIFLGKSFGAKTVYTSLLLSVLLSLFQRIFPMSAPLTNQPVLELGFAIALPAVGAAILFFLNASGGGTDVIAMILKKYSNFNIGQALFYTDLVFVLLSGFVFGIETLLFSFAGLMIKALLIDNVIASLNQVKYCNVVCSEKEKICDYITHELKRSATSCDGTGAYTHDPKTIVFTALTSAEAAKLRRYIKEIEPKAFIMMSNSSEIFGRGFRQE